MYKNIVVPVDVFDAGLADKAINFGTNSVNYSIDGYKRMIRT